MTELFIDDGTTDNPCNARIPNYIIIVLIVIIVAHESQTKAH